MYGCKSWRRIERKTRRDYIRKEIFMDGLPKKADEKIVKEDWRMSYPHIIGEEKTTRGIFKESVRRARLKKNKQFEEQSSRKWESI